MENLLIKYRRRNKNVNGFFSCSCGFEYMETVIKEQGERSKGQRRFVRVVKYGPLWEAKVRELLESGMSIQEVAARLNADIRTVRRYTSEKYRGKTKSWQSIMVLLLRSLKQKDSITGESGFR